MSSDNDDDIVRCVGDMRSCSSHLDTAWIKSTLSCPAIKNVFENGDSMIEGPLTPSCKRNIINHLVVIGRLCVTIRDDGIITDHHFRSAYRKNTQTLFVTPIQLVDPSYSQPIGFPAGTFDRMGTDQLHGIHWHLTSITVVGDATVLVSDIDDTEDAAVFNTARFTASTSGTGCIYVPRTTGAPLGITEIEVRMDGPGRIDLSGILIGETCTAFLKNHAIFFCNVKPDIYIDGIRTAGCIISATRMEARTETKVTKVATEDEGSSGDESSEEYASSDEDIAAAAGTKRSRGPALSGKRVECM